MIKLMLLMNEYQLLLQDRFLFSKVASGGGWGVSERVKGVKCTHFSYQIRPADIMYRMNSEYS